MVRGAAPHLACRFRKVAARLRNLTLHEFFGVVRFDDNGQNTGHPMLVLQATLIRTVEGYGGAHHRAMLVVCSTLPSKARIRHPEPR